jgi:hypothetical protein
MLAGSLLVSTSQGRFFLLACRHFALSALLHGLKLPYDSLKSSTLAPQDTAPQDTAVLSPAQVQAVAAEMDRHARARFRWVL